MSAPARGGGRILSADDSLLLIIDVQTHFLNKLDRHVADAVTNRVAWLAALACWLGVPAIATAEEIDRHGGPVAPIARALAAGTPTFDKPIFGLAGAPAIMAAVAASGRRTAVLVGLETDVCVLQSALGLLDAGYRVAVVQDAVASPGPAHAAGLARMQALGVELLTVKGLYYEWARTVERASGFLDAYPALGAPLGIAL